MSKSVFSIIVHIGWPMWLLVILSLVSLALVVERFISLQRAKILPAKLLDEAFTATRTSLPSLEVVAHLENSSIYGKVLAAGLRAMHANPKASEADVRSALEGAGRAAAHQLARFSSALATIAAIAPLLGLLGTVVGLIDIFTIQGATNGANPAEMAGGIAMALYTTASGLLVAIPTLIFWRYFRARVDAYLLSMEVGTEAFARHLARFCKQ